MPHSGSLQIRGRRERRKWAGRWRKMEKRDVLPSFGAATKQQEEHNMSEKTSQGYDTRIIEKVPIHLKVVLTIREAAEYSNIGINKIESMLRQPNCPFVLYVGTRKLVKRKAFEEYISSKVLL